MIINKLDVCAWIIFWYSLRDWNGKGKEHDLEKIASDAVLAWAMAGGENH
jgi:hypothetical protein